MGYGPVGQLEVYPMAEQAADRFYALIQPWQPFDRNTTGEQMIRAADSVGANIADGYGRFHYGDQLRFLYLHAAVYSRPNTGYAELKSEIYSTPKSAKTRPIISIQCGKNSTRLSVTGIIGEKMALRTKQTK